jgi:hypothetical protein
MRIKVMNTRAAVTACMMTGTQAHKRIAVVSIGIVLKGA